MLDLTKLTLHKGKDAKNIVFQLNFGISSKYAIGKVYNNVQM